MNRPSENSLPIEFKERITDRLGLSANRFFESLLEEPPVAIRINPLKWKHPIKLEKIPWSSNGYYLQQRPSFTLDPLFHGGAYYVQEPSSMLLEAAFSAVKTEQPIMVLDLCGAPGGKSTHLLSLMGPDDLLVTNEVIRSRASILQENIQKWGYGNAVVTNSDPRAFAKFGAHFDVVIVDAPCSGEGLFRKDMGSISEWSIDNTRLCSARQKRIIADAWEALKPGGFLIYSTCTYNEAENEQNLHWLVQEKNATPVELPMHPHWNIDPIRHHDVIGYQVFPHKVRGEGFFIGVVSKPGTASDPKWPKSNSERWKGVAPKVADELRHYFLEAGMAQFIQKEEVSYYFPTRWLSLLPTFDRHFSILQAGIPVSMEKGTDFFPHPALAYANQYRRGSLPECELSLEASIKFLKRENLSFPLAPKGWLLSTYQSIPLGWVKNLGNRANNYFPKDRHIRMEAQNIPEPWYLQP